MTQNTQTTTERIATLISARIGTLTNQHSIDAIARNLAAEIDRLTAERDEARAEVERLRLPAEAWEAYRALWAAPFSDPDKRDAAETQYQVAIAADSAARARATKVTP